MIKTQSFKFAVLWKSEYNVQGHKLSLEHLNSRKRFGVKILNTFWNYKDFSIKLLKFNKEHSFSNNLLKTFIGVEIASFIYFKLFKFSSKNETINMLFNHEQKKSYILNILLLNTFGKYIAISYPHIFNKILLTGVLFSIPITSIETKISQKIENKLNIDNFVIFSETNLLPKLFFSAGLVKFLDTFLSDKLWNLFFKADQKYLKLNRKTILLTLNLVLIAKLTQFLSIFLADEIK